MSEKIANTLTFHGNAEVKALETEIVRRLTEDKENGNNEITAIKRILFGLPEDAEFNAYQKMGAHWAHLLPSDGKLVILSKQCALYALQDFITLHVAKIDPQVVVQMDYEGNTPSLIGCRFTALDSAGSIVNGKAEEELDHWYCDEEDVEQFIADLKADGHQQPSVMSYQELEALKNDCAGRALDNFRYYSGREYFSPVTHNPLDPEQDLRAALNALVDEFQSLLNKD